MEFSPSEVFIPHSKETMLQPLPLPLVAYVAVCTGVGGWVGVGEAWWWWWLGRGWRRNWHLRGNNDGRSFGSLEPQS